MHVLDDVSVLVAVKLGHLALGLAELDEDVGVGGVDGDTHQVHDDVTHQRHANRLTQVREVTCRVGTPDRSKRLRRKSRRGFSYFYLVRPSLDELFFPVHRVCKKNGQSIRRKSFFFKYVFFFIN